MTAVATHASGSAVRGRFRRMPKLPAVFDTHTHGVYQP